ncbi:hypothetical protein ES703_117523 [subsurface metagenome]
MELAGDSFALLFLDSGNLLQIVSQVFLHLFFLGDVSGDVLEGYQLTIAEDGAGGYLQGCFGSILSEQVLLIGLGYGLTFH